MFMRTIVAGPFGKVARMDEKIINEGFNDNNFTSTVSQV